MMEIKTIAATLGGNFDVVATDGARALRELQLSANAAVLDVGTGKGNFAIFLASQGLQVLTGEPSNDTSRYARQDWIASAEKVGLRDRIRFEHFGADRMPFPEGSFDAVFFFGVLHHIEEAVRVEVLCEALRVARKSGSVVFFEPRRAMLERVWVDDPNHPLDADPSQYLRETTVREQRLEGEFMDIFIFRKS